MKLTDLVIGKRIFMGLKGEPGCGKTIQAVSFAMGGDTYVFDCDNRMAPVILFHSRQPYANRISFDTYHRNYPKFAAKLEELYKSCPYDTIIVDSLTALADMIMLQSIMTAGSSGSDAERKNRIIGGVKLAGIEDYAMEDGALTQVFDALRGLKCNVILTAHVVETRTSDLKSKKETVRRSLLTGGKKIAAKIPVYFDEFYHLYARPGISGGGMEYILNTTHSSDDWAKTALPLPDEIDLTQDKNKISPEKFLYPQLMNHVRDYKAMFAENVPTEA